MGKCCFRGFSEAFVPHRETSEDARCRLRGGRKQPGVVFSRSRLGRQERTRTAAFRNDARAQIPVSIPNRRQ